VNLSFLSVSPNIRLIFFHCLSNFGVQYVTINITQRRILKYELNNSIHPIIGSKYKVNLKGSSFSISGSPSLVVIRYLIKLEMIFSGVYS